MSRPAKSPFEVTPLAELARRHTEEAVGVLAKLLGSQNERTQLEAVESLLDRGWGKVSATGSTPSPAQLVRDAFDELPYEDLKTLAELMEILKQRREGKA